MATVSFKAAEKPHMKNFMVNQTLMDKVLELLGVKSGTVTITGVTTKAQTTSVQADLGATVDYKITIQTDFLIRVKEG